MKKRKIIRALVVIGVMLLSFTAVNDTYAAERYIKSPDDVVVKQSGKTSLTLSWKKVSGAKGYEIYKSRPCLGGYAKVKTLKGKTKWKDKSVGARRTGTYKVRAYGTYNGKKVYSDFSYPVSARTCGKDDKTRNAAKPWLGYSGQNDELTLGIREPIGIDLDEKFYVEVKGEKKKGSKKSSKAINKKVRWFSTDEETVKANSRKDIRAGSKPGKAYVYVRTHNGLKSKMIPVIVKDYAYEEFNIKSAPSAIQIMWGISEKDMRDICSYYSKNRIKDYFEIRLRNGEEYVTKGTVPDDEMIPVIKRVLEATPYSDVAVEVGAVNVRFQIVIPPLDEHGGGGEYYLYFSFDRDKETSLKELTEYWRCREKWYV